MCHTGGHRSPSLQGRTTLLWTHAPPSHEKTRIETVSSAREPLIHSLMTAETGISAPYGLI